MYCACAISRTVILESTAFPGTIFLGMSRRGVSTLSGLEEQRLSRQDAVHVAPVDA